MTRARVRAALWLWLGLAATPALAAEAVSSTWLAGFNTWRLGEGLALVSDLQYRQRGDEAGPRNVLLRPGLALQLAPGHTVAAGYAYIGSDVDGRPYATEHRSWQQYVRAGTLAGQPLMQRLRLEQRFIGRPAGPDVYSDRLRWFARNVRPLGADAPFTRGAFLALQNEVMVNLSARDDLNGQVFDQNRAYVALGWRLAPGTDVEIGYLNQWVAGRREDAVNHVLQLAIYTQGGR